MITLCIETATARVGVALTRDGRLLAETLLDAPGGLQNRLLLPVLQQLLSDCRLTLDQIDLFACAVGPGSFTGIRTGIAAVQGLALAHDKPCLGISTLAMLAMNLSGASYPVCTLLDARKNEVYGACFRVADLPEPLFAETVAPPARILASLTGPTLFAGDGALQYRSLITATLGPNALFTSPVQAVPRPAHGCRLAEAAFAAGNGLRPEQLLPVYLRPSEAELSRQTKS